MNCFGVKEENAQGAPYPNDDAVIRSFVSPNDKKG